MRHRALFTGAAAGLLCLAAVLMILSVLPTSEDTASPVLDGPYTVFRVVDGDTLDIQTGNGTERVRLIGVDTPESVHPDASRNTAEGLIASTWLKDLLEGEDVYLEFDLQGRDKYDRVLAYVYLADQETMVNRLLLEEGLAQIMTVPPNVKYADEFAVIQSSAREAGAGFWAEAYNDTEEESA